MTVVMLFPRYIATPSETDSQIEVRNKYISEMKRIECINNQKIFYREARTIYNGRQGNGKWRRDIL